MIRTGRLIRKGSISVGTNGVINALLSIQGLKDFEGEFKERKDGQMWRGSRWIWCFFPKEIIHFHYCSSEENDQVLLCLKGVRDSDCWSKPLGSVHFVTVNLSGKIALIWVTRNINQIISSNCQESFSTMSCDFILIDFWLLQLVWFLFILTHIY